MRDDKTPHTERLRAQFLGKRFAALAELPEEQRRANDLLTLLLYYDKIAMAVLATITILLLTVLVATDSVDSTDRGDPTPR